MGEEGERQMIKAYIIERAFGAPDNATLDELENLVNNRIAEGYVPVGVPFYFEKGIAQAMLKSSGEAIIKQVGEMC